MTRTAAYIRVSTDQQTAENQLPSILDYCKSHWWPEPEVYAENESAWKAGHQAELAKLLRELRTGRRAYDYLVIFALDRLSRGGIRAIFPLLDAFEGQNCKVVSVKESWLPVSGSLRDLFISMVSWAAQYESDRKSQNTKAGLERARLQGRFPGRPRGSKDKVKRLKRRPVVYKYGGKEE